MSIPHDSNNKFRNDEYENVYGKSHGDVLTYNNMHRRIKSRSEAYYGDKNYCNTAMNM